MPSEHQVKLAANTFGEEEITAAVAVLRSGNLTSGAKVRAFEEAFAAKYGFKHAVAVNSGSSANLLAVSALQAIERLPLIGSVGVPAVTWPTSVWPLVQCGLFPVVMDVDVATWCLSSRIVAPIVRDRGFVGVLPVHVYGNCCDLDWVDALPVIPVIEDCCEALGATFGGGHSVGLIGDCATFSFYFSHHISTMEGGMVCTASADVHEMLLKQRAHGWMRDVGVEAMAAAHARRHISPALDPAFTFYTAGYNFRMTELQAAIGLVQLDKVDGFVAARRRARTSYVAALQEFKDVLSWQEATPGTEPSWFGMGLMARAGAPFSRQQITDALRAAGIETRPIIAGNIARQPAMVRLIHGRRAAVHGSLPVADDIMNQAFSIGCHQGISDDDVDYVATVIRDFVRGSA